MSDPAAQDDSKNPNWEDVVWAGPEICEAFFGQAKMEKFHGVGPGAVLLLQSFVRISRAPQSGGGIVRAYRDALEYADGSLALLGFPTLGALMVSVPFWFLILTGQVSSVIARPSSLFSQMLDTVMFLICVVSIVILLRMDFSGPRYSPTLYDRGSKKVHVYVGGSSFFGLWPSFLGGKARVDSYDWSCVRAEVRPFNVRGSNYSQKLASLHCIVLAGPADTNVVGQFVTGFISGRDSVQSLINRWEHIRRFMEEGGPHFTGDDKPQTWVEHFSLGRALGEGQPFFAAEGEGRSRSFWAALLLVFVPVTASFGLLRWIVFHMKEAPRWPKEIAAGLGAPLTKWRTK